MFVFVCGQQLDKRKHDRGATKLVLTIRCPSYYHDLHIVLHHMWIRYTLVPYNRLFYMLSNYYLTVIQICSCVITLSDRNSKHCLFLSILK